MAVVKNVAIFEKITSFSVVFVFMPFRHEPDAQWRLLKKSDFQNRTPSFAKNPLVFITKSLKCAEFGG
ncbi:MAG: hypothetical protein J6K89_06265, partial [Oscillospiraceae bacterium]|nr:hypothetical protein [Oscillospiraceae bacterium]